jgi:hypothetical protein
MTHYIALMVGKVFHNGLKITAANSVHITAAGFLQLENLFHYLRLARATRRGSEIRSRNMRGSLCARRLRKIRFQNHA